MHLFTVKDLEEEAKQKAGKDTGWATHRSVAVAYYPNSGRFNYFIATGVVSKKEFEAYLSKY
jgi:hypothetical protein